MGFKLVKIDGGSTGATVQANDATIEAVVSNFVAYNSGGTAATFTLYSDGVQILSESVDANGSYRLPDKFNIPATTTLTIDTDATVTATVSVYVGAVDTPAALTAAQQAAVDAAAALDAFNAITATATGLGSGDAATASFDSATGVLSIGVPQGIQGETGNGIASIAFTSTTNPAGTASGAGYTDTYTITYTDTTTDTFVVYNGLDSTVQSVAGRTGDVVLTIKDVVGLNEALSSIETHLIETPTITNPTSGTIDFIGAVTASAYTTLSTYKGVHTSSIWECATDSSFSSIVDSYTGSDNLTTWTPSIGMALTQIYARVRYESDGHLSSWSDPISFTTPNIYIETPTLTIDGEPSDVGETPTITTSAFSVFNGSDTHVSTDWEVRLASDDSLVWSSMADTTNKLSITTGALNTATTYKFRARHNSETYGSSSWVEVQATTKSAFAPTQGQLGFSVEPTSEPFAALGLAEMTGTNIIGHDNYGNYIHTNGSIVCWMARKWYRVGSAESPRYATYGANAIDMLHASAFVDEATANASGYILPRAFIDGGAIKSGFFIDKYKASKKADNVNVSVSVKNGNPIGLTTSSTYTPSSTMTGCTGILADAVTLSRARGAGWNCTSVFMRGWLTLCSLAQAQAATNTTDCAWYDATGVKNYPKGCNNGSLADVDDTSVTWSGSPDKAGKGLTGSASNLAKSTHNGSNNGVADVNGLMYEVDIGLTNYGTSATDSTQYSTNTLYVLKQTSSLKDLTAGWDGATDAWGNVTNLSTRFDAVTSPITISTGGALYWGNGTNAVVADSQTGVTRDLCGFFPKNDNSVNGTGTNLFGLDYLYTYNEANMVVRSCGGWGSASGAGSSYRLLDSSRSSGDVNGGFRSCAYVS